MASKRSPLAIATASLRRLVEEEKSYREELEQEQKALEAFEKSQEDDEEGNREYMIKQRVRVTFFFYGIESLEQMIERFHSVKPLNKQRQ